MKLKTVEIDGKTFAEVSGGKPVYLDDEGEKAIDVPDMVQTISSLNHEAMTRRQEAGKLKEAMDKFKDLDPDAARDALDKLAKLDAKKLIDAGEVDKVRESVASQYEERLKEKEQEVNQLRSSYATEKLENAFNGSQFIRERMAIPGDIARSFFGKHFQVDDGKLTPLDESGNPILSKSNPGKPAEFDEAIEILVERYPQKDAILKATGSNGSGAQTPESGAGGKRTLRRSEFDKMEPEAQRKAATDPEVSIVD